MPRVPDREQVINLCSALRGGRKCDKQTGFELPRTEDAEKAATMIFYERHVTARQHKEYVRQKKLHKENYEAK